MLEIEKPNKRNVERLLKREFEIREHYREPEYMSLQSQVDEMEERHAEILKKNRKYAALCKKKDQLEAALQKNVKYWKDRVAEVRREFYAKGLTPAVLKKIEKLVDDYNNQGIKCRPIK